MKRKAVLVVVSLLLLVSLVPMGVGCSDDTINWTAATFSLADDIETEVLQDFAAMVEENSDGRLKIRVTTGGQLYEGTDIFNQVSNGNLQLGLCTIGYYYQQMPKYVSVFSQIWGDSVADRIKYFDAQLDVDCIAAELETYNIQPLMYFGSGWLEYYFVSEDFTTFPDDAAGLNLVSPGAAGDAIIQYILQATPKTVDHSEIATQVQGGQIDGIGIMPLMNYVENEMYGLIKTVVMTYAMNYPYHCQMNKDAFEELDEDLQQVLLDAAETYQIIGLNKTDEENDAAIDDLKDMDAAGTINFIELTGVAQVTFKAQESGAFEQSLAPSEGVFTQAEYDAVIAAKDAVTATL